MPLAIVSSLATRVFSNSLNTRSGLSCTDLVALFHSSLFFFGVYFKASSPACINFTKSFGGVSVSNTVSANLRVFWFVSLVSGASLAIFLSVLVSSSILSSLLSFSSAFTTLFSAFSPYFNCTYPSKSISTPFCRKFATAFSISSYLLNHKACFASSLSSGSAYASRISCSRSLTSRLVS